MEIGDTLLVDKDGVIVKGFYYHNDRHGGNVYVLKNRRGLRPITEVFRIKLTPMRIPLTFYADVRVVLIEKNIFKPVNSQIDDTIIHDI